MTVAVQSVTEQWSCADNCVPKWSLGTRGKGEGLSFLRGHFFFALRLNPMRGSGAREIAEGELRLARFCSGGATGARVDAIGFKHPRLHAIGQVGRQNFVGDPLAQACVAHREDYLDAAEEIARHPIGAAEINLRASVVAEIKDPAVLEEPAHDAGDADVVAHARYARA